MLTLLQSFYMTFYVLVFAYRISIYKESPGIIQFLALLPPILIMFVFLPLLLPVYSLLTHVEELSHQDNIEYILMRMYGEEFEQKNEADGDIHCNGKQVISNLLGPSPTGLGMSSHPLHASFYRHRKENHQAKQNPKSDDDS